MIYYFVLFNQIISTMSYIKYLNNKYAKLKRKIFQQKNVKVSIK